MALIGSIVKVGSLTGVSRAGGFLRDILIAHALGTGPIQAVGHELRIPRLGAEVAQAREELLGRGGSSARRMRMREPSGKRSSCRSFSVSRASTASTRRPRWSARRRRGPR